MRCTDQIRELKFKLLHFHLDVWYYKILSTEIEQVNMYNMEVGVLLFSFTS